MPPAGSRITIQLDPRPATRAPHAYLTYPGDAPHILKAIEPDTTAVMVMEHV